MQTTTSPPEIPPENRVYILPIDWENVFYSLADKYDNNFEDVNLEYRLRKLKEWVQSHGKLWGHGTVARDGKISEGHGRIFVPEHLSAPHSRIIVGLNFTTELCPKLELPEPKLDTKSGLYKDVVDTVDDAIIDWTLSMIHSQSNVTDICLAAADKDYIPMLKQARECGIRISLAPPTEEALAWNKEIVDLVDVDPATGEKLLFMLDQVV